MATWRSRGKYDSQKPVVLRWEGQQPIYNPRYRSEAVSETCSRGSQ